MARSNPDLVESLFGTGSQYISEMQGAISQILQDEGNDSDYGLAACRREMMRGANRQFEPRSRQEHEVFRDFLGVLCAFAVKNGT